MHNNVLMGKPTPRSERPKINKEKTNGKIINPAKTGNTGAAVNTALPNWYKWIKRQSDCYESICYKW